MVNESRQGSAVEIARGVVHAFRISVAVCIAFAASLFVVMLQTGAVPLELFLPSLCGFVATVAVRGAFRGLSISIPKFIGTLTSISLYAIAALAIWLDVSGLSKDPLQQPQYFSFFICIGIGYWLAGIVIEADPSSRPFARLQAAYGSLISSIGNAISIGEVIAFGIAMLLSLAINVPAPHLEVQSVLTGSAVLVMTSLLWFAQFAAAAKPADSEPSQP